MDEFFNKVKVAVPNCNCERDEFDDENETIIFTHRVCHHQPVVFRLETFFEVIDKLVEETPQLGRKMYVGIAYQVVSKEPIWNMFRKEIPQFKVNFMDFTCKRGDFRAVAYDFFRDVDRKRFVNFQDIQIVFRGINDPLFID